MEITIRETSPDEAEELIEIQKAAFLPLYEKYHDLDNKIANNVIKNIKSLAENAIVIVVSHDDRLKEQADKTIFLKKSQTDEDSERTTLETHVESLIKPAEGNA